MRISRTSFHAVLFALAGYTFWAAADSFIKLAGALNVPKYEIVGVAAFSGILFLGLITLLRGRAQNLRPRHIKALSLQGVLMILNYAFVLLGVRNLPLVNFYAVVFMAPLLVGCTAAWLFNEKLEWPKVLATLCGFVGVLIAMDVFSVHDQGSWIGYGFAFLNVFVMVAQQLMMRFLGERESRECVAIYPRIGPVIATLIGGCLLGFEPMSGIAVLYSTAIGALGGLGWFLMAEAYQRAPASTVAPYHYSQIVSAAFFGYLLWGYVPSAHLWMGAIIIVASGVFIATHSKKMQIEAEFSTDGIN